MGFSMEARLLVERVDQSVSEGGEEGREGGRGDGNNHTMGHVC